MIAFALASLAAAPIQQSSLDGFNKSSHIRELSPSQGCINCCVGHDCTAGYNGMPGICCGSAPAYGCCPMGAICVKCNSHWTCSNSAMVSITSKCTSLCRDDPPPECYYRYGGHYGGHYGRLVDRSGPQPCSLDPRVLTTATPGPAVHRPGPPPAPPFLSNAVVTG